MSYIKDSLIPGETVAYATRLHWIVLLVPALTASFIGMAGVSWLVAAFATPGSEGRGFDVMVILGMVCLLVATVVLGLGIWKRSATEMAVTNKRVLIKIGLVSRRTVEILLPKVESVNVDQSVGARMLGYGTVTIHGTGGTPESFKKIGRPLEFRRQVQRQIEALQTSERGAA